MEKSTSLGNLAKALATFQGKVDKVKKDGFNPHFKSSFASLGNIIETIQKPLSECGLSYCQLPDGDEALTTILMHAETGEFLQATYQIHAAKKDPQGLGSAITYARRYALGALLGIMVDDDDDGEKAMSAAGKHTANGQSAAPVTLSQDQTNKVREATLAIAEFKNHADLLVYRDNQPAFVRNHPQFIAAGEGQWAKIELDMSAAKAKSGKPLQPA